MVFSGTATKYLAEKICQSLGCPLGKLQMTKFSDGEFAVSYEESIRGLHRLVQSMPSFLTLAGLVKTARTNHASRLVPNWWPTC